MSDNPAANPSLEAFLAAVPPAAPPAAPADPPGSQPEPSDKSDKPDKPAPPAPVEEPDHDDGSGMVPIAVLRKTREDNKSRAAAAEARVEELRAQIEQLKQGQPPPPQPPAEQARAPRVPPNPAIDPLGYVAYIQEEITNKALHASEAALRRALGDEPVNETQQAFRKLADQDKTLWGKLYEQPDPYAWAHSYVQRQKAMDEIGADPEAWRKREREAMEAEFRAKLGQAQEPAQQAAPVSPVAGIPPSLANARSGAARGQTFSGPPPIDDIVGRRSGDLFIRQR